MTLKKRLLAISHHRCVKQAGKIALGLTAVLALIAAPVVPFSQNQPISWNAAFAGNNGGGSGNGGGGNGGGGNGGGGGNNGGGNAGGGGGTGNTGAGNVTAEINKGGGGYNSQKLLIEQGVSLAQFTTKISKRYPTDNVALHQMPHQAITFFTEVNGLAGHVLSHRWIYQGTVQYQADFKIRAATWKAWSTQVLPVEKAGEWRVEIVDDNGTVLTERTLDYQPVETANTEAGDG